jgi:hypothetical protein
VIDQEPQDGSADPAGEQRKAAAMALPIAGSTDHVIFLDLANGLTRLAALTLGRLFVVTVALEFSGKPFALAEALETLEHLLNRLVAARPDLNHA